MFHILLLQINSTNPVPGGRDQWSCVTWRGSQMKETWPCRTTTNDKWLTFDKKKLKRLRHQGQPWGCHGFCLSKKEKMKSAVVWLLDTVIPEVILLFLILLDDWEQIGHLKPTYTFPLAGGKTSCLDTYALRQSVYNGVKLNYWKTFVKMNLLKT